MAEVSLARNFPDWKTRVNEVRQRTNETMKEKADAIVYLIKVMEHPAYGQLLRLTTEIGEVTKVHSERLKTLVLANLTNRTRTDVNGHYRFAGLARGGYYVF